MKNIFLISFLLVICLFSRNVQGQYQNIFGTPEVFQPQPGRVGQPGELSFKLNFFDGVTLGPSPEDEVTFSICFPFNRASSMRRSTTKVDYIIDEDNGGTSTGYIQLLYNDFSGCYLGYIKEDVKPWSSAVVRVFGVVPDTTRTMANLSAMDAFGYLVNLQEHSRGNPIENDNEIEEQTFVLDALVDLKVEIEADKTTAAVGDFVTYTITASNNGPSHARGVKLVDLLPPGLELISAEPSQGIFTNGVWYLDDKGSAARKDDTNYELLVGESETLKLVAKIVGSEDIKTETTIRAWENEDSTTLIDNTDTVTIVVANENISSIKLLKVGEFSQTDGTISYSFTVYNTGNVSLSNIELRDTLLSSSTIDLNASVIAPGDSLKGTAIYTVSTTDFVNGKVINSATVIAEDPMGASISAVSGSTLLNTDPTETLVIGTPNVNLVKTGIFESSTGVINYTFTIENTGNVPVSNIDLRDGLLSAGSISVNPTTIGVGETAVASVQYTVQSADFVSGKVINTAQVTVEGPQGNSITVNSGNAKSNTEPTETVVTRCPQGKVCVTSKAVKIK